MFGREESERAFVVECIKLYRKLPVLWDVKCKEYHNQRQKQLAYDVLLKKFREVYPKATRIDVRKKINILRTNYRKAYRKYKEGLNASTDPESVPQPTLWYYNLFSFLNDPDDNTSKQDATSMDDEVQNIYVEESEVNYSENQSSSDENKEEYLTVLPHKSSSKRKRIEWDEEEELFNSLASGQEDFQHWALACAEDLRKMDREQQIYAKRAIAEIIMKGELGQLTCDFELKEQ